VAVKLVLVQITDLPDPQKGVQRSRAPKQRKQPLNLAKTRTVNATVSGVQTTAKADNAKAVNAVGAPNRSHPSWKKHGRV
jgi:hypothetical protein